MNFDILVNVYGATMAELSSQPTSIQSIYSMYTEEKLYVNRRYQRKLVWTLEEKQKLIESILKRYPVPAILIAEREGQVGSYEIIDGLQRLHAIISFIETSFPTLDGKYFDIQHFPSAKGRSDSGIFTPPPTTNWVSQKEISTILDYSLALSIMRNATEEEVNDVFGRINTYGHRLSDQERRQSGVQNNFSNMVRNIACDLRGDTSDDSLMLSKMPSISIDLPKTKHGYSIQADEVFWVKQGILRATDLRDSMDEQSIADIAACIVGGKLIERSKSALDEIYIPTSDESERINAALNIYGPEKFTSEFKYCFEKIEEICETDSPDKLRNILFGKGTTNPFPAVFTLLVIAFHEIIVGSNKKISDYSGIRKAITDLSSRIAKGQKASSEAARRKNINTIKGLIQECFVDGDAKEIYENHTIIDIEDIIRRSEIELPNYELKQGILDITNTDRKENRKVIDKIINTICGIANNGLNRAGKIVIGVTDKDEDAIKIEGLDKISSRKIGKHNVVGICREAKFLGISNENYYQKIIGAIKKSDLQPEQIKQSVLSAMDYHDFHGLGVIVISIPPQSTISFVGEKAFRRSGNDTEEVSSPKEIAEITKRFHK